MKFGVLFSGGKDSTLATWFAKKHCNDISCLITIVSSNKNSYMFHTPSISKTKKQAEAMNIPLMVEKTKGGKESELKDLERAMKKAKAKYKIQGIVTGAVESVYQASRIQKICDNLGLECFNPLWHKDQFELLEDLIKNKFQVIITGVAAYPLDGSWLGRIIDKKFIKDLKPLVEKYKINPAGEGGEFETFVLAAPGLFKKSLKVTDAKISGEKNSWRMEIEVE
ncbi:MAG: diphthine--ammonia ligase [Nanoarchaeota archaeon]|nr:diphthine--ammonia ligase [Nanoarchaeota archaeon]MBU1501289.1 diphthine--ammonia ligase [Nanoarchaeota archaeon]MBU2459237.1 diphthine--ammonia ligase [Nanoarchaeota archaeon]